MKLKLSLFLYLGLFSVSLIASPGAHGPNGEHLEQNNKSNGEIGRQADGSVLMPMKHQALLNIRTQFASLTVANKYVQMDAVVKPHPEGYAIIQPSSDGRLDATTHGLPTSGTKIEAGDILGFIRYQYTAFDLTNQTSELVAVRNQIEQTNRDVNRLTRLGDLASRQKLEQLQTQLTIFKQQEKVLQKGLEKSEALVSPISGILINNSVSRGQWVEAGKTLFEIVSPEKFIFEGVTSDIELVNKLSTAEVMQVPGLSLNYLGHSPESVNGLVHTNFENQSRIKKNNLLLNQTVTIKAPIDEKIEGILLPSKAIVLSPNNLPQVWIKLSAERFLPQIVEYQPQEPGVVVVTNGLGADNRVVVEGASLLNQVR
ncbi:efflux RND transporter periplasmic adaptor subunit [Aliikangiella sp. G2MR2-5]|uniref:efflux RND transporter periplasmic adaptor subunit n=1 Tax=Aliikangiella sp. G2MR2-5 TaxID=2788943 RepID=UPI0018A8845D|nr:HlyD family efflux transporter periplasmic adaptor subunit [Aliikangiella sp. G2MR2-5]